MPCLCDLTSRHPQYPSTGGLGLGAHFCHAVLQLRDTGKHRPLLPCSILVSLDLCKLDHQATVSLDWCRPDRQATVSLDWCRPEHHATVSLYWCRPDYQATVSSFSTHISVCLSSFSPGRSPISFDHEIVMMNHVYKERFPKVPSHKNDSFISVLTFVYYDLVDINRFRN